MLMAACFVGLTLLPDLRGPNTPLFLLLFLAAAGGYIFEILLLKRDHLSLKSIFGFAILFRLILLFSSPSLSDDVYRYIWDGYLLNRGINPYQFPVNSPALDAFTTPLRSLVNHSWMATPYQPVAQLVFGAVEWIMPQSPKAFQLTALVFDLLAGWLLSDLLGRFGLPKKNVLIYLWNPLVIIEFAHGAHIDSLMIFLTLLAVWLLVKDAGRKRPGSPGSALVLAAAGLTKLIPIFLVPIFWWRWTWKDRLLFGAALIGVMGLFSWNAGLGLMGPLDGTGVMGAVRIYLAHWQFNSGIHHWLQVWIAGFQTSGAIPLDLDGRAPFTIARAISSSLLGFSILLTGGLAWKMTRTDQDSDPGKNLKLIRLALVPLGAYLLLTSTVHPWYVAFVIPFLPFFFPADDKKPRTQYYAIPWIYFSIAVAFSYLAYLDPDDFREIPWVRLLEYIPLYGLLIWTVLASGIGIRKPGPIPSN